jgi:hypothetical protein
MVIGEKFAWAHLQKTGGNATLEMFRFFPELIVFADPSNLEVKHSSFGDREDQVAGKILSCNIRRLPAFLLSWAVWRARPGSDAGKAMESPDEIVTHARADIRLTAITDGGRFRVDRWLRMEALAVDFLDFVSGFATVTDEHRSKVLELQRMNTLEYDHEVANWFSERQIKTMYENNPAWRAIEEKVYGDLSV